MKLFTFKYQDNGVFALFAIQAENKVIARALLISFLQVPNTDYPITKWKLISIQYENGKIEEVEE
ncbi:MAG: hypothetical protein IPM56_16080 [Ignavibacteriales bacterium]|nr:MAG: hypothetical protein IPM56_16080 [Ignavibacteriales bacterium]